MPHEPDIDWEAAQRSPEFQELVTTRRRFVLPATIFFLTWFLVFELLCGYAPDFMGRSVYEGVTVGYVWALSQFVMVWGLAYWYLRKADDEFDPLAERAAQAAIDLSRGEPSARTGRFDRIASPADTPTPAPSEETPR
ncbi:MAG: DUF485 domain-containing protein [Solirubrobacteraceae bacterium]|nr:DUF485 domain-containing protein [Solirubrobacteraceae bacterium]